ncbi:CPBP family intramembrane glutamic endopeptidase [Salinimicrobium catena]|uniref:CPBP family intramembrane glutamic endopeptidase n=1 Tax=Salinimicrobium catena TaxID=390640 RepID=UPI002FE44558
MFIEQAFKAKTDWWRYLIGMIIVFIAWQIIGGLPLMAAIILEMGPEIFTMTESSDMMKVLQTLDSNVAFFLLLLMFAVGLGALLLVIRLLHQQPLVEATTSRKKVDWGRFFFGFGIIAVFTIVATIIDYNLRPEDFLWNFDLVPFLILAAIAVIMVPLQTSFEEYLFRGYLMQGLGIMAGNKWFPLIVTSVLFGSLHLWNPEVEKLGYVIMIYYIGTGLLLGIMTLMDEGLELALGFHFGNNLIGALLITADWTAFQTHSILKDVSEPTAGFDIIVPVLIVYPIFLFLMAKTYRWTNWRERLFGRVTRPESINYSEEI